MNATFTPSAALDLKMRELFLTFNPEGRREALDAAGELLVQMARRAHTEAETRPAPWARKADGKESRLFDRGRMREGWRAEAATSDSVNVGNNAPYAGIHQEGRRTGPHIIRAKNKKGLRFVINGTVIIRKSVKHPGSKMPPRPALPVINGRLTPRAELRLSGLFERRIKAKVGI